MRGTEKKPGAPRRPPRASVSPYKRMSSSSQRPIPPCKFPRSWRARIPPAPRPHGDPYLDGGELGGERPLGSRALGHARPDHCYTRESLHETPLRMENRPDRKAASGARGPVCGKGRPPPRRNGPELPRHGPSPAALGGTQGRPQCPLGCWKAPGPPGGGWWVMGVQSPSGDQARVSGSLWIRLKSSQPT